MAVAAIILAPVLATPASAHGRGSDATNYDSRVISEPEVAGATWQVHGGDELLEVDSPEREITVLGYSGEPYLRVGPDGVFENRNSPAVYLNQDRYRTELPPGASADPDAEPAWERVSRGTSFAWHDHRTHVMTAALPREVAADPGTARLVQEWSVPVAADGVEASVEGELRWVPGPSPWPWVAAGLLATLPALAGVRADGERRLLRPAAAVLAVVALLNLTHVLDDLFAMPLPATTIALSVLQSALFLGIGLLGAAKGWRGGDGAATALAVGSAAVLVGQGLLYLSALSASQLTSVSPAQLGRFVVAVSIGQAVWVGAVAIIANRRLLPDDLDAEQDVPAPA